MSQEEPALTRDQITAQELALIQQVRGLEIRREQHVQRPGSHPPLGLIKYDNRRYLEVRQGFQPILVPDHMVTIVRTFLAQNLPQHVQALREREQSPPNTPRSMSSVTSGITNLAMASDLRLPAAHEPNDSRFMVSRFQLTRPPEAAPSVFTQPRSLPLSELDSSQFGQLHSTSEPLSPPPDEMGLSSHNLPTLPYAESSLFTTVASQGLYDHINAAASFMTSIPGVSLPNTAAGSMADAIPSTPVATAAPAVAASVPNGNMGLMSSPPQSLSSSYSNPHPFGGSFFPAPVDREETGSLPQLSLSGSTKPTNHTRKISASSQRKTSRSITRKQATMPYPDTSAVKESAGLRNSAPKNDDLDSTMDVDDGYDGDGNGNNDDNMSTSSYGNNNNNSSTNSKASKGTTAVAAEAGKKTDDKRSALSEDIEDDEQPLRKPPNAFILYRRMKNERLRAERPGISVEAASGVIGKYWREEPEEVKQEFHQLANKAREVYFAKKKRLQARQKQRRLEREELQQQQQQHKGLGSGDSSRQKPPNVSSSKPKRKMSKSLSSPAQSLVVSSSRGLSSFSPETLAKKRPASTDFRDLDTAGLSASPLVRMTRSLTDTSGSDKKQDIHQSLAMPAFSFSPQHQQSQHQHQHQQSIGMLSTLLEHKVEPCSSNSQPGNSLGEAQASPDMEQHVTATVATLQQAFDDVTRTQQISPIASSMDMGAGSPPWSANSQTAEKDGWEGMLSSLFQRNN